MKLLNLNLTKCIHLGWVSFQLGILEDVKEPTCHWIPAWHFKLQFVGHTHIHQWPIQAFRGEGVCQPIILQNFCQKLHENERILTDGRMYFETVTQ